MKEPYERSKEENILRIGDREFSVGVNVNFNNGDGIEKDWMLWNFSDTEVVLRKLTGSGKNMDPRTKMAEGDLGFIDKTISIEEFLELQK